MIKLIPVIVNEKDHQLKHGDVFTMNWDNTDPKLHRMNSKGWEKGKHFIAVPHNYESRSLRKIWSKKILIEEKRLTAIKGNDSGS